MAIPYGDVFTMMLMACHYDHGMLNAVSTDDADGITTFVLEKKRKIGGKKNFQ